MKLLNIYKSVTNDGYLLEFENGTFVPSNSSKALDELGKSFFPKGEVNPTNLPAKRKYTWKEKTFPVANTGATKRKYNKKKKPK